MHNKTNIEIIKKCKPVYSAIMQIFLFEKYPICVGQSCVIFLLDIFFYSEKRIAKQSRSVLWDGSRDPSCETDLEFWDRSRREKTLSNNQRNMVMRHWAWRETSQKIPILTDAILSRRSILVLSGLYILQTGTTRRMTGETTGKVILPQITSPDKRTQLVTLNLNRVSNWAGPEWKQLP